MYATFLRRVADHLRTELDVGVENLDGKMARTSRDKAVARFSDDGGPPILCVSLKAGGTGLNLVRAKLASMRMDETLLNRGVNEGFSGGEKKRNEIMQMSLLEPTLALLDETDSGLDIDALKVVAEGVESRDILEMLVTLECDIAQGFAVGRPMSLEGLTKRVTSGRRRTAA